MADKINLKERLNAINFPIGLQEGKMNVGRGKKRVQSSTKIQGLQTLKNTLGRQYMQKQSDYRTDKI